jgi:hypothetical protein
VAVHGAKLVHSSQTTECKLRSDSPEPKDPGYCAAKSCQRGVGGLNKDMRILYGEPDMTHSQVTHPQWFGGL